MSVNFEFRCFESADFMYLSVIQHGIAVCRQGNFVECLTVRDTDPSEDGFNLIVVGIRPFRQGICECVF